MSDLKQGENYEPDVDESTSESRQRPAKKMNKPFKAPEIGNSPLAGIDIDPKYIAIGIVVVVVLAGIIMAMIAKPFKKKEAQTEETVWETAAAASAEESTTSAIQGMAPSTSVETMPPVQVTDEAGMAVQQTDASGNLVKDANGNPVYETLPAETVVTAPTTVKYSDKELALLRKYGYTTDEIEQSASLGIKAKVLLADAKEARERLAYDTIKKLGDTGTPEYQEIYYNTWLQGEPRNLNGVDPSVIPVLSSATINVDYTKLPARGPQLWVKLKLPDGQYAFMSVTPQRYVQLNDSGNMVVTINTSTQGNEKFIVSIVEEEVERDDSDSNLAGY
jgi:hypothetical protein